jgi:hypothetical protein
VRKKNSEYQAGAAVIHGYDLGSQQRLGISLDGASPRKAYAYAGGEQKGVDAGFYVALTRATQKPL